MTVEAHVNVEDGVLKVSTACSGSTCCKPDESSAAFVTFQINMQSIGGFTWPGIEYGEAPKFKYSFFEVRLHAAFSLYNDYDRGCLSRLGLSRTHSTLMRYGSATWTPSP